MSETVISVTEATRNFADCVNRAHYRNETLVRVKSRVPFARLVPDAERTCTGEPLAAAIAGNSLTPVEARAWAEDLMSPANELASDLGAGEVPAVLRAHSSAVRAGDS